MGIEASTEDVSDKDDGGGLGVLGASPEEGRPHLQQRKEGRRRLQQERTRKQTGHGPLGVRAAAATPAEEGRRLQQERIQRGTGRGRAEGPSGVRAAAATFFSRARVYYW
jgi:hypothetical protein